MPRKARQLSSSNIYHAILRGINKQTVMEDDGDRHYFMTVLRTCKELSGFRIHAFCIMSNHVHLLIEPGDEPLDMIFRRIGIRYAMWYNRKYQRTGHLFQDRFRSENVDNDLYYMTVLRYILQNPMKANLETRPGTYRWSSFLAYQKGIGSVTDTEFAIDLFGSREALIDYVLQGNDDQVMDDEEDDPGISDEQAKKIMNRISGCYAVADFQRLDKALRKEYICLLYRENLSMNQISRITGVPKTTVIRTIRNKITLPTFEEEHPQMHETEAFGFNWENIIW